MRHIEQEEEGPTQEEEEGDTQKTPPPPQGIRYRKVGGSGARLPSPKNKAQCSWYSHAGHSPALSKTRSQCGNECLCNPFYPRTTNTGILFCCCCCQPRCECPTRHCREGCTTTDQREACCIGQEVVDRLFCLFWPV